MEERPRANRNWSVDGQRGASLIEQMKKLPSGLTLGAPRSVSVGQQWHIAGRGDDIRDFDDRLLYLILYRFYQMDRVLMACRGRRKTPLCCCYATRQKRNPLPDPPPPLGNEGP